MRDPAPCDMSLTENTESETIDQKALRKEIFSLAGPTMFEQLLQSAVNYIDTAMVGSIGTLATAAVGSTMTANWLLMGSISAVGVGFLAFISQSFGAKKFDRAKRASMQAFIIAMFIGILTTTVMVLISRKVPVWMQADPSIVKAAGNYFFIISLAMLPRTASILFAIILRSAGDTKTPMKISALVNVINVVGNYFLIYPTRQIALFGRSMTMPGMGWGVEGAAIASAFSFLVGGVLITIAYLKHPKISPLGAPFKLEKEILRPCLKVAFPNMLQRFGTSFGYVVFASLINSLGEISTAAHTIANTVESAFYIPGFGMQTAAATLSGNVIGAKDRLKQKRIVVEIRKIEFLLMIVSGGLLFAFAPALVGIFSKDPEVIRLGSVVLRMVAVSEPLYGISIVTEGVLQGAGKTTVPLIFNICTMWGIRILGTLIFARMMGLGLVAAWGSMIAHNMMLFALFILYFRRGNWNLLKERELS